jgi:AcrR family transcriptional regulator
VSSIRTAGTPGPASREVRRQAIHDAILDAAWDLVREEGLAGLSLRDLAKRAGTTTPTVYAYFANKHAIYDAMFGQAMAEFADLSAAAATTTDPRGALIEGLTRFATFCTSDVARYQLLFQRTIPGFEPSASSYAHSLRAYDVMVAQLAACGVTGPRAIDLWTALTTGLVDQQISNDPGGSRWIGLIEEAVSLFLDHHHGATR